MKKPLTIEACKEYFEKARDIGRNPQDIGERRELRLDLQGKYNVTELEAVNILNGFYWDIYIVISGRRADEERMRDYEE